MPVPNSRAACRGRIFMKKVTSYIWDYKWLYLAAILCLIISVGLDMLAPQLTKQIIDDVIVAGNTSKLIWLLLGILGIGAGRCIFSYIKEFTSDYLGSTIGAKMRLALFNHIQKLSTEFFDRTNTGELMARVKEDIDRVWDGLGFIGMLIFEIVFHTGIILFCMFRLNATLAVLPAVCMVFCGGLALFMEHKLGKVYEEISEENAVLNTVAEENLAGVRTVKAFAREKFEIRKFLSHNKRYYELNMKQSKLFVKYDPIFTFISRLLPIVTLLIGGGMVMRGEFSLGSLGAFVEYSNNIVWPMEMLGWVTNSFSSAVASNKKIRKIYQEKPAVLEKETPVILPKITGKITFDHVSFEKTDRIKGENGQEIMKPVEILRDISFTVNPGKTIGIMGATGAGKSSLIYLLQRLYDCTDGAILLDDTDIRDLTLKQLRGNISTVMQDVFLFSDTISENVKLGKKELVNHSVIRQASADAQASGFIEKMENQYETVIGERGVGLSGGQKQRISIARALAKKNPVLVLDDSTSALDMETEHLIQQTLKTFHDTTKIIIAHRISSVRSADEILVLNEGRIAERGTHETLLAGKGLYYETYMAQYGDYLEKKEA